MYDFLLPQDKNMVKFLEHLGQEAGIKTKREQIFLCFAGPPYNLLTSWD